MISRSRALRPGIWGPAAYIRRSWFPSNLEIILTASSLPAHCSETLPDRNPACTFPTYNHARQTFAPDDALPRRAWDCSQQCQHRDRGARRFSSDCMHLRWIDFGTCDSLTTSPTHHSRCRGYRTVIKALPSKAGWSTPSSPWTVFRRRRSRIVSRPTRSASNCRRARGRFSQGTI